MRQPPQRVNADGWLNWRSLERLAHDRDMLARIAAFEARNAAGRIVRTQRPVSIDGLTVL